MLTSQKVPQIITILKFQPATGLRVVPIKIKVKMDHCHQVAPNCSHDQKGLVSGASCQPGSPQSFHHSCSCGTYNLHDWSFWTLFIILGMCRRVNVFLLHKMSLYSTYAVLQLVFSPHLKCHHFMSVPIDFAALYVTAMIIIYLNNQSGFGWWFTWHAFQGPENQEAGKNQKGF